MSDSRQSIWPVLASMFVTWVVTRILLRENRRKLLYGVVTFYSVTELLKMAFHPALLWVLRKLIDENNHKIEVSVYRDRIRGMRHDMKNYIADMEALMSGQPEQTPLRQYLDSLQTSVEQLDMKYHTGNPVSDVILQRYVQLAEKNGIDFQADFLFPVNMNIDAFDLSIIFNNALDNALEACKRQIVHHETGCRRAWSGPSEY